MHCNGSLADRQFALLIAKLPSTIAQTEPLKALVVGHHYPAGNLTTDADWEE